MENHETVSCDVLVIGAGGAGLRAAIAAAEEGVDVALVCKSLLGKAHTVMAEGGMAAALRNVDDRDSWQVHFRDTMRGGKMLNQWRMAEIHAKEAPARAHELEAWGALFDRTGDGRILQRNFGGHRYPRLAHVGDRTGLEMIRTLQNHAIHTGLKVFMEMTVVELLQDSQGMAGALAYWRESGKFVVFRAKAVVLATGGVGKAYRITSNSWEYTADGHALAYRAGADLIDMEFLQFHPTGMIWPPSVRGVLVTEGVRGEGGILRNAEGERFMFNYIPELFASETAKDAAEAGRWLKGDRQAHRPPELLTRDVVARAIRDEVRAGRGSPHGGALLDIASQRDADYIKRKLPSMYHQFYQLGDLDITKQPMEVGPTCHYVMGGVRVHPETAQASVPGLYAAGECAGGMHGANRLGGNSLSDLLVFGRRAGLNAAQHAQERSDPNPEPQRIQEGIAEALQPFAQEGRSSDNPYTILQELQTTMEDNAGIVRDATGLRQGLEDVQQLAERLPQAQVTGNRQYNPSWHYAVDLRNLISIAESIAICALGREESRGGHTRTDFPQSDTTWEEQNSIISRQPDGSMQLKHEKRDPMPQELAELIK